MRSGTAQRLLKPNLQTWEMFEVRGIWPERALQVGGNEVLQGNLCCRARRLPRAAKKAAARWLTTARPNRAHCLATECRLTNRSCCRLAARLCVLVWGIFRARRKSTVVLTKSGRQRSHAADLFLVESLNLNDFCVIREAIGRFVFEAVRNPSE